METIDYKQKIKDYMNSSEVDTLYKSMLNNLFPELKESEDEKIRKSIIAIINNYVDNSNTFKPEMIAWLEKQGDTFTKKDVDDAYLKGISDAKHELEKQSKQKPILDFKAADWYVNKVDGKIHNIYQSVDKVEPKFKVGDWVVYDKNRIGVIVRLLSEHYIISFDGREEQISFAWEQNIRKWTIQDAKNGDVLVASDGSIFIFAGVVNYACKYYVGLTTDNVIEVDNMSEHYWETAKAVHPATKEQRDLLFQKMKEAGYEWDDKKRKLKKIKQKPVIKLELDDNGEPVLTPFEAELFSMMSEAWQGYLFGQEVNIAKIVKEHSIELLERANEQNSAWSEDDENVLEDIEEAIINYWHGDTQDILLDWLKSLKERCTWKPSDEQMKQLGWAVVQNKDNIIGKELMTLYNDLEKLKGEV